MKTNFNLSLVIAAALVALGLVIAAGGEEEAASVISTSGSGSVEVAPNEAAVMVRIETKAENAKDSQEENAKLSSDVIDALQAAGIKKDAIETSSYSLWENKVYDPRLSRAVSDGFVTSHILQVTTADVDSTGSIVDTAVKAGATGIDSVTFTLDEETQKQVRQQALAKAVTAAEEKADVLAQQLGVRRGSVYAVAESSFGIVPLQRAFVAEAAATQILPGDVSVEASVTVQFRIK